MRDQRQRLCTDAMGFAALGFAPGVFPLSAGENRNCEPHRTPIAGAPAGVCLHAKEPTVFFKPDPSLPSMKFGDMVGYLSRLRDPAVPWAQVLRRVHERGIPVESVIVPLLAVMREHGATGEESVQQVATLLHPRLKERVFTSNGRSVREGGPRWLERISQWAPHIFRVVEGVGFDPAMRLALAHQMCVFFQGEDHTHRALRRTVCSAAGVRVQDQAAVERLRVPSTGPKIEGLTVEMVGATA